MCQLVPYEQPGHGPDLLKRKRAAYMAGQGEAVAVATTSPFYCGLASGADRLFLQLPFHRPLEEGQGRGLGLAAAALRLHRLRHELGPGVSMIKS